MIYDAFICLGFWLPCVHFSWCSLMLSSFSWYHCLPSYAFTAPLTTESLLSLICGNISSAFLEKVDLNCGQVVWNDWNDLSVIGFLGCKHWKCIRNKKKICSLSSQQRPVDTLECPRPECWLTPGNCTSSRGEIYTEKSQIKPHSDPSPPQGMSVPHQQHHSLCSGTYMSRRGATGQGQRSITDPVDQNDNDKMT